MRLLLATVLALTVSAPLACKPRGGESQTKDLGATGPAADLDPQEQAAAPGAMPAVCQDRSVFESDPKRACTRAYCDFLANADQLPFYKVLDTGNLLNDVKGRGRALKNVDALLDLLIQASPDLQKLYACNSGVWERVTDPAAMQRVRAQLDAAWPQGEWRATETGRPGLPYTIGFHTRRVLQVFNDQRKYYDIPNTTFDGYRYQSYPMMVWMVALHDVGKAVAAEEKNTALQHEFIPAIARAALTRMQVPPYEVELAVRIIDHDLVGDYMKTRGAEKAQAERALVQGMNERAAASKISVRDFWFMQRLFYMADATSYAAIRSKYFGEITKTSKHAFTASDVTAATGEAWHSGELKPTDGQIVPVDGSLIRLDQLFGL